MSIVYFLRTCSDSSVITAVYFAGPGGILPRTGKGSAGAFSPACGAGPAVLISPGYPQTTKPPPEYGGGFAFGGPGGIRTLDLCDANAALSQLSYGRIGITTLNSLPLFHGFVKAFLRRRCRRRKRTKFCLFPCRKDSESLVLTDRRGL